MATAAAYKHHGTLRALRVRDALRAVLFGAVAGNVIAVLLTVEHFGGFGEMADADISAYPVAPLIWGIAATAAVQYAFVFYIMSTRNLWIRDDLGMSFQVQDVVLGLGSWLALIAAGYALFSWILPGLGVDVEDNIDAQFPQPFTRARELEIVLFIALVGLVVPILEEILFRGIVLRAIEIRTHPAVGILASSALFGIAHVGTFTSDDIPILAFSFTAGLIFSSVCVWTGRLSPGIIAHTLNNVFATIAVTS